MTRQLHLQRKAHPHVRMRRKGKDPASPGPRKTPHARHLRCGMMPMGSQQRSDSFDARLDRQIRAMLSETICGWGNCHPTQAGLRSPTVHAANPPRRIHPTKRVLIGEYLEHLSTPCCIQGIHKILAPSTLRRAATPGSARWGSNPGKPIPGRATRFVSFYPV